MELRPSKYVLVANLGETTPLWEIPARPPIHYVLMWIRRPLLQMAMPVHAKAFQEVTLKQFLVQAPDGTLVVRPVFVVGWLDLGP
jgi:hypothetical protein